MHRNATAITEWLVGDECHELSGSAFVESLGHMLLKHHVPVHRLALHVRPHHPTIFARSFVWARDEQVKFVDLEHGAERSRGIQESPIAHVMSTREWFMLHPADRRLDRYETLFWGNLGEVRIAPLVHGPDERSVSAVSFGTQSARGFSKVHVALLRRILPGLRCAVELKLWRRTAEVMLDTYIGTDAERRILSGRTRRGDIETIQAALMFCDLRGFTELSNRVSSARVLTLLNKYFDEVVPSVLEFGGDVLKFMGDGLMAFFRQTGGAAQSCAAALKAAQAINPRLAKVAQRDADLVAGVGLHFGEVSYGNIGSGQRLDFTVIGRDVNFASRIQGLCWDLSQPVLLSERFASLVPSPTVSVGRHHLKGFAEPAELFAPLMPGHSAQIQIAD